jgi:hypothetical protein
MTITLTATDTLETEEVFALLAQATGYQEMTPEGEPNPKSEFDHNGEYILQHVKMLVENQSANNARRSLSDKQNEERRAAEEAARVATTQKFAATEMTIY